MKRLATAAVIVLMLAGFSLIFLPSGARAHEQETFVDWTVAYQNLNFLGAPVFTEMKNNAAHPGTVDGSGAYPTININTGDRVRVDYAFHYVGARERRGDLFWVTRLGLDFGTLGKYVDDPSTTNGRQWLGSSSFALIPGHQYTATLVLRTLQPTLRHLHVGVSVQDVGNIPAAPTVNPIPAGGPTLYGIFTNAQGAVVEPLAGETVATTSGSTAAPFGNLKLLEPWPWAVGGLIAQIVIGLGFIGAMFWFGRWANKKGGAWA